jgi:hypothetical protein
MARAMACFSDRSLRTPETAMKHHHAATTAAKSVPSKKSAESATMAETAGVTPDSTAAGSKDEFVRETAYYYYQARGCIGGHELDDWLRAEAEFERMKGEGEQASASANAKH